MCIRFDTNDCNVQVCTIMCSYNEKSKLIFCSLYRYNIFMAIVHYMYFILTIFLDVRNFSEWFIKPTFAPFWWIILFFDCVLATTCIPLFVCVTFKKKQKNTFEFMKLHIMYTWSLFVKELTKKIIIKKKNILHTTCERCPYNNM